MTTGIKATDLAAREQKILVKKNLITEITMTGNRVEREVLIKLLLNTVMKEIQEEIEELDEARRQL